MSERSRMLGERVEIRQRRQRMAVGCSALRERLRELLSPVLEPDEMDGNAILDTAAALHSELGDLEMLSSKLVLLNRELGE